jgi:hypothetical protein
MKQVPVLSTVFKTSMAESQGNPDNIHLSDVMEHGAKINGLVSMETDLPGPPQTNWTRIVSKRGLLKISVNETDTATSGLRWIFHMHSEFSRPAMCNNAIKNFSQ